MAIKILKLTSTEDIIGDYKEKDGKCFMNKPAKLAMFPTEDGGMGMALIPWIPFSNDEAVEIKKDCIMLNSMEPSHEIRNEYNKRYGSGVITPTKDLIL